MVSTTTIGRPCREGIGDSLTLSVDVGAQAAVVRLLESCATRKGVRLLEGLRNSHDVDCDDVVELLVDDADVWAQGTTLGGCAIDD